MPKFVANAKSFMRVFNNLYKMDDFFCNLWQNDKGKQRREALFFR